MVIGGFWLLNSGRPVWEDALRTIIVFTVLVVFARLKLRHRGVVVHLVPLIASKVTLVVIAAGVELVLRNSGVGHAGLFVALGLGVAVCLVGAVADRFFFTVVDSTSARPVGPRR